MEEENQECQCSDDGEYHQCPYQAEIYDNYSDDFCNCCDYCREQCGLDV